MVKSHTGPSHPPASPHNSIMHLRWSLTVLSLLAVALAAALPIVEPELAVRDGLSDRGWRRDGSNNRDWRRDGSNNRDWRRDGSNNRDWRRDGSNNRDWRRDGSNNRDW
ncbi:hypothetical protein GGX14DRAFT_490383 [Mycena pura]|uniref:Uncharacterized protein n=1 Tax=Mycena pura TaxID=153505 RepID=A0AAD6YQS4_9AGAR|nr:hypothetical protein GGX14DRAFT_490383 [Mycena pura]